MVRVSRLLSLVLRHRPDEIGITLDAAGWVGIDELLAALAAHGTPLSREALLELVATSDKQRFALNEDRTRIRAQQGHSVEVELGYAPAVPPEQLYHGTVGRFLKAIQRDGLHRGTRHHVHLSPDFETAQKVGQRRGRPVVLIVEAGAMHRAGHAFFVTPNAVWLVDHVPPSFLGTADR